MVKQLPSNTVAALCCLLALTLYLATPAVAQIIQSPSVNPGPLPGAQPGAKGGHSAVGNPHAQNQNRGTTNQGQNSSTSGTRQTPRTNLNQGRAPYNNTGVSSGGNTGAGTNPSRGRTGGTGAGTGMGTGAGSGSGTSTGSTPGVIGR